MQIVEGDNVKGVQHTKQKESEQIKCLVLNCSETNIGEQNL